MTDFNFNHVVWLVSIFIFVSLWPVMKTRPAWYAGLGALLLTPTFTYYSGVHNFISVWPFIAAFPAYILSLPESLISLGYLILWTSGTWVIVFTILTAIEAARR